MKLVISLVKNSFLKKLRAIREFFSQYAYSDLVFRTETLVKIEQNLCPELMSYADPLIPLRQMIAQRQEGFWVKKIESESRHPPLRGLS